MRQPYWMELVRPTGSASLPLRYYASLPNGMLIVDRWSGRRAGVRRILFRLTVHPDCAACGTIWARAESGPNIYILLLLSACFTRAESSLTHTPIPQQDNRCQLDAPC
ncbi:hypothetical protein CHELA1G11_20608 [Hyphomicrobiales bacterium]|nr:hypothetical protein CHELA1G11_20608 [Hyphomicrobiales bacterium]CAH1691044.1 hypothetical protein CHELA1G2_20924 [Hyphomicrobiales bacterium]